MKTRSEREQELVQLASSKAGVESIRRLWKKNKGVAEGADTAETISALVKQEMIPDILSHEFPAEK